MKLPTTFRLHAVLLAAVLAATAACSNPVGDRGGHRVATNVVITEADGTTIVTQTEANAAWTAPLTLQAGQSREIRVFFVAPGGERFQLPAAGASHTLHVGVANTTVARFDPSTTELARFHGQAAGATTARVHLWHGVFPQGHEDFVTPDLTIQVAP